MNVTVDTPALAKALQTLKPAVPSSRALPVLTGVALQANGDGRLQLRATDLDTTIETSIRAQVDEPGQTVVSYRTFARLVRGKGKTRLSVEDGHVKIEPVITVVGTVASLVTLTDLDFPPEPTPPKAKPFVLPLEALARILPASSTDEARPILTMVLFDGNELAATDSYRLHREVMPTANYPRFLLPASTIKLVMKAPGPITASIDFHRRSPGSETREPDKIELRAADGTRWHVTPSRWGSDFPNYKQLIPTGYPSWMRFDRRTLLDALADIERFLVNHGSPARFDPHPDEGVMKVSCQEVDRGATLAAISCEFENPKGRYPHVAFSPDYLADAVRCCPDDEVVLGLLDSLKPALILGAGESRDPIQGLRLLMPVRVP